MIEYSTGFSAFVEAVVFFLLFEAVSLFLIQVIIMVRIDLMLSHMVTVPGKPILQHVFLLTNKAKFLDIMTNFVNKYGSLIRVKLFAGVSAMLITDLNVVEFLLGTTTILEKSVSYMFLHNWLGDGLLISSGDTWKNRRKVLTPAFHFQILEHYVETFHSATSVLVNKMKGHVGESSFNVFPYVTLCTLDIICESAMGTKVNAQQNAHSEYVDAVREMGRIVVDRSTNPFKIFFTYVFTRDYWLERRYLKILHEYTDSVIKRRRDDLLKNPKLINNRKRPAFLDLILQTTIDGESLADHEIRAEVDTFMFAGHDTTASGISFTLYCLSKNPDIQEKVVEELDNIFGSDRDRPATLKELQNMTYLGMVIKEALRLYPPVPVFARMPFWDTTYNRMVFPYLSQLFICSYVIHRNPELYPNPETFNPDRFLPENQSNKHPYSYLAFSAGPRNCIGQKFAILELKSTVSHILRNFVIKPVEGFKPQLAPIPVLKSLNGILIRLENRK